MIRTQIYLPKDLKLEIKMIAKKENKSEAVVIRESLKRDIYKNRKKKNAGDALLAIANMAVKGAPKDLSKNIDKYLYEEWDQK